MNSLLLCEFVRDRVNDWQSEEQEKPMSTDRKMMGDRLEEEDSRGAAECAMISPCLDRFRVSFFILYYIVTSLR